MWTANTQNQPDGTVVVSATFIDKVTSLNFSYGATVRPAEFGDFIQKAKDGLVAFQAVKENEDTFKSKLEGALNA